ncbi:MAG: dockerin type I repeat-containing protein, partial [Bacteroidaceae bacterium]|nr:dockerin type I repeat-containing protein [Bacteroidaceae bacterium]
KTQTPLTVNGLCGVLQNDTIKASQNVAIYNYNEETELPHTWQIVEDQTVVKPCKAYLKLNGGIPAIAYDEIEMAMLVVGAATANPADVNGDTKVNTADVVAVYTFIEKGSESGFTREACDVNGDGNVNTADVVAIYTAIIGSSGSSSPRWKQRILND